MNVLLDNKEDWKEYQNLLCILGRYDYDFLSKPVEYPCIVMSTIPFEPNIDAPYSYNHSFVYRGKNFCPTCGQKTSDWGNIQFLDINDFIWEIKEFVEGM